MLATLALGVPGAPSEALGGPPLSAVGLACAAVLVYISLALPRPGWLTERWLALGLVGVVVLKLAAAATAPPVGLLASYWPSATPTGAAERSTEFPWLADATRIESRLKLSGEDFGVFFFNDAARFNFGPEVQPGRDQLPFGVEWRGWLLVPSDGQRRFVLVSSGPASAQIDGAALAGSDARLDLSAGPHSLRVSYTRLEDSLPRLALSWERVPGGPLLDVGGADVRWQPDTRSAGLSTGLGTLADWLLAGLVAAWLVAGSRRIGRAGLGRAALGAVPLVLLAHGMLLHAPLAGRSTVLSGLDDWLIYESSARDILLNGPLMNGGQAHAAPFYGQPLYPYVLALAHRLTGESLFGPLALQFAALGCTLIGAALLARRAFGSRLDALAALACAWLLVQLEPEHFKVARQLFNENLYMPLVMASLIAVVDLARPRRPPAWWRAALVGGLLGLAVISRSQFLLFVPFGVLIVVIAWRSRPRAAVLAALTILAGVVLVIAPVTVRNWVVSGQFVPISSSGGASLLEFHRPPPGLIDPASLQTDPLFEALHLDVQTRTVLAFIRADPRGYLATLLPLGAHSVGLPGRNDPGIYWPLFITVLVYLASLGLASTRRLHVWPIHAFVATHLLILMLFEADTYGYRLVVPMYAPMAVVASQGVLAAVRSAMRLARQARRTGADARRAGRYAEIGWALVAGVAVLAQAKGLAEVWSDRETSLHGLGGPAARAAATAERTGAEAIYVASIDGTPRRFGAGSLPGLRYPWFRWFDPSRSVPLPAGPSTAVYMLSELAGKSLPGDLLACLGPPDADAQVVIGGEQARQRCANGLLAASALGVSFDGVARFDALQIPGSVVAGEPLESRLLWQPLVDHPEPQQVSLQLDDPSIGDGTLWGNGTADLYPASEWKTGDPVLSRLPIATDATAVPQQYRLTLGIGPARPGAAPSTAGWQGSRTDRVPVAQVALSLGSTPVGQALPADMRPVEGPPLVGGGLELVGARPLPGEAPIGGPLRVGLLWRATEDAPRVSQLSLRLVRGSGEVVQTAVVPILGGRLAPSALREGNVVRDEETLLIDPRLSPEPLWLQVGILDAQVRLGSLTLSGRAHTFDAATPAEATFGDDLQLLSEQVEPAQARPNDRITIKLRWRAAAQMTQAYKVFVHVLAPAEDQVIAQRDAEPQDGRAPTTGWLVGEVIEDAYAITLPPGLAAGDYPIEVGVYDARSGERLPLANGDNRVVLSTRLHVP